VVMTFKSLFAVPAGHGRRALSLFVALSAFVALGAPACGSSSGAGAAAAAQFQACALNSDCASNLICALGKCTIQCRMDSDCTAGDSCSVGPGPDGGQIAACVSNITPCNTQADCPAPLACASDYRCRNLCTTPSDCNVLGITGDVCGVDSQGVHYCAAMSDTTAETADGGGTIYVITEAPPMGATGTVTEPTLDATTGGGSSGSSSGAASSSGGAGSSSGSGSGGSSGSAAACNSMNCGVGHECTDAGCVVCGGAVGEACCGTTCNTNLTCVTATGLCACGDPGQECCNGTMCNNGVTCTAGACACGAAGTACCPSGSASACTGTLQCAGLDCTCEVGCSGNMVRRSDGTLWVDGTELTTNSDSPFVATSFSQYYDSSGASGLGCAVDASGGAWCWGSNSYGQLGNGNAGSVTSSAIPVQVVTSAGGPGLPNVAKVFVDNYEGFLACAIDTSTNVWCWGYGNYGALGNGYQDNSEFAVPVVLSSGGAQLTGVTDMSVSYDHVCATKSDGTAWCWGYNNYGQIGQGNSSTQYYLFPTQVQGLYTDTVNVSVGYGFSCAATTDYSVYCWGTNSYGDLGNGLTTGIATQPVVVAPQDGGTAFGGAQIARVQVSAYYGEGSVCAITLSGGDLWCWGYEFTPNPAPYTEGGFPVTGVYLLCPNGASDPTFIDSSGALHYDGSKASPQVSCP